MPDKGSTLTKCHKCEPGYYTDTVGATTCKLCPKGYYCISGYGVFPCRYNNTPANIESGKGEASSPYLRKLQCNLWNLTATLQDFTEPRFTTVGSLLPHNNVALGCRKEILVLCVVSGSKHSRLALARRQRLLLSHAWCVPQLHG